MHLENLKNFILGPFQAPFDPKYSKKKNLPKKKKKKKKSKSIFKSLCLSPHGKNYKNYMHYFFIKLETPHFKLISDPFRPKTLK